MKRPRPVTVFGILLIISSLLHIDTLVKGRSWYTSTIYAYMPAWLATTRYLFSWLQRILGLCAGIGILRLKNLYRHLAILIGYFTIITIYWKHPYQGYLNNTKNMDQKFGPLLESSGIQQAMRSIGLPEIKFVSYTLGAVIINSFLDILFCALLIYYLTRPKIKEVFR